MELLISIVSSAFAVLAVIISFWTMFEARRVAKLQTNLELLSYGNDILKENPSTLKLHGINDELLKKYHMNVYDFLYLLNSFYAGQAYHTIGQHKKVTISPYRKIILDQTFVKEVWTDLIRNKMIFSSLFSKAIDDYYGIK